MYYQVKKSPLYFAFNCKNQQQSMCEMCKQFGCVCIGLISNPIVHSPASEERLAEIVFCNQSHHVLRMKHDLLRCDFCCIVNEIRVEHNRETRSDLILV